MQRVVPALKVNSYTASSAFYEQLGFVEVWRHQPEPTHPIFAGLVRDGMEINLTEHAEDCQAGGLVHFYVPDVDALHAELLQKGVRIQQQPQNNLGPHIRDMLIVDLDGNRLSFLTVNQSAEESV